jgi:hypothetical protein
MEFVAEVAALSGDAAFPSLAVGDGRCCWIDVAFSFVGFWPHHVPLAGDERLVREWAS